MKYQIYRYITCVESKEIHMKKIWQIIEYIVTDLDRENVLRLEQVKQEE